MSRQASQFTASPPLSPRSRPERRWLGAETAQDTGAQRILGISTSLLLGLFMATLLVPAEFRVGIRLTPYTALLIVFIVPLVLHFLHDRSNRIIALDGFMALYVVWIGLAILINHGPSRAVFIVNQTITLYGGYLVGRVLIRGEADYKRLFTYFLFGLLFLLPFVLLELLTRKLLINDIFSMVATVHTRAGQGMRLGLNRVQGVFEHSITYGLFCSIAISNLFYVYRDQLAKRLSATGLAAFMTFISLSSAPNIAMGMQFAMIAWDRTAQIFRTRWVVLVGSGLLGLGVIQMATENGIVGLIIENFAFDPTTGWGRTEIFEYGSAEVLRNPLFGIGLGEWIRPWWRKSSVDNFWLLTAMRYGLPALGFLWVGLAIHALRIMFRGGLSETAAAYRTGYLLAWVGVVFVLGTVHIWGAVSVFIMTYIGAGAWFYTNDAPPPRNRRAAAQGVERGSKQAPARGIDRTGRLAASPGATGTAARQGVADTRRRGVPLPGQEDSPRDR